MSDNRNPNDPYRTYRRNESNAMWGWVAGIAVLALIVIVIVYSNMETRVASNDARPPTTTSAPANRPATPPAETPAKTPATPAPANQGTAR
jgi:hypothetical protein